jgi:hypothetical protein
VSGQSTISLGSWWLFHPFQASGYFPCKLNYMPRPLPNSLPATIALLDNCFKRCNIRYVWHCWSLVVLPLLVGAAQESACGHHQRTSSAWSARDEEYSQHNFLRDNPKWLHLSITLSSSWKSGDIVCSLLDTVWGTCWTSATRLALGIGGRTCPVSCPSWGNGWVRHSRVVKGHNFFVQAKSFLTNFIRISFEIP